MHLSVHIHSSDRVCICMRESCVCGLLLYGLSPCYVEAMSLGVLSLCKVTFGEQVVVRIKTKHGPAICGLEEKWCVSGHHPWWCHSIHFQPARGSGGLWTLLVDIFFVLWVKAFVCQLALDTSQSEKTLHVYWYKVHIISSLCWPGQTWEWGDDTEHIPFETDLVTYISPESRVGDNLCSKSLSGKPHDYYQDQAYSTGQEWNWLLGGWVGVKWSKTKRPVILLVLCPKSLQNGSTRHS